MSLKQDHPPTSKMKLGRKYVAKRPLSSFFPHRDSSSIFLLIVLVPLCVVVSYVVGVKFLFSRSLPTHLSRQYRHELLGFRSTSTSSRSASHSMDRGSPLLWPASSGPASSLLPTVPSSPAHQGLPSGMNTERRHAGGGSSRDARKRQRTAAIRGEGSIAAPGTADDEAAVPPKLAFLFHTKGLLPLTPLWERFFEGYDDQFSVYVLPTRMEKDGLEPTLPPVFRQNVLPSFPARWGVMSIVTAERILLGAALADPANTHFILLSESCIPLWPFHHIRDYVFEYPISYVDSAPDPTNATFGYSSIPFLNATSPLQPAEFRKGSQWFILRRRHAQIVLDDSLYTPVFDEVCKYLTKAKFKSCCADEFYIQTLLQRRDPAGISHYPTTFADWRGMSRRFGHVGSTHRRDAAAAAAAALAAAAAAATAPPVMSSRSEGQSQLSKEQQDVPLGKAQAVKGIAWAQPPAQGREDARAGSGELALGAAASRRLLEESSARKEGEEGTEGKEKGMEKEARNATAFLAGWVEIQGAVLPRRQVDMMMRRLGAANASQLKASIWFGAMHPKAYGPRISQGVILSMKNETEFLKLRPLVSRKVVHDPTLASRLPDFEKTPERGFCSVNRELRPCFLFARKFKRAALPFLLQHSKELLGF